MAKKLHELADDGETTQEKTKPILENEIQNLQDAVVITDLPEPDEMTPREKRRQKGIERKNRADAKRDKKRASSK